MQRKTVYLPVDLADKAKQLAKRSGLSFSFLVRDALERFFECEQGKKIEAEAIEAIRFYYRTDKQLAAEWRSAELKTT